MVAARRQILFRQVFEGAFIAAAENTTRSAARAG
jgi:hypothetical protein